MAARTSNGTGGGNWSATTTWSGGVVPLAGDTVTIASTDTVTYDVTTGVALAGVAINGTLRASTTAGAYVLLMDGTSAHNIVLGSAGKLLAYTALTTSTGALAAGTTTVIPLTSTVGFTSGDQITIVDGVNTEYRTISSVSAGVSITVSAGVTNSHASGITIVDNYPAAASFTINLNGASYISAGGYTGNIQLFCYQPTWCGVTVAAASSSATSLTITGYITTQGYVTQTSQDLTTDAQWASGRSANADDVYSSGMPSSHTVTLGTIAASTIAVSALPAALHSGALVWLLYRNVSITGYTGINAAIAYPLTSVIQCAVLLGSGGYGFTGSFNCLYAGIIANGAIAWNYGASRSSTLAGVCTGQTTFCTAQDQVLQMSGWISGTPLALNISFNALVTGYITGCGSGLQAPAGTCLSGSMGG